MTKLIKLVEVDSTNDYILQFIKTGEPIIVIAEKQTKGRGTKGRSFSSTGGGLYLSKIEYHNKLLPKNAFNIIVKYSMAVLETLKYFNINAKIKWPNDIYVNGKKICGMLTENHLKDGFIDYTILGIGININNELDDEIKNIATTVKDEGVNITVDEFLNKLIINMDKQYLFNDYLNNSLVVGNNIFVTTNEECYSDKAITVLENGGLELASGKIVYSAEVKIKL